MKEEDRNSVLYTKELSKRFPGVVALDNVDFEVEEGKINSLIGENGAGKTTLMKVISSEYDADAGRVCFKGQDITNLSVREIRKLGLEYVHQDLNLVEMLSVGENIMLGKEKGVTYNRTHIIEEAREYMEMVDESIDVRDPVQDLELGQKQLVDIARSLTRNADLIVFDEPTARLGLDRSDRVLEMIKKLNEKKGTTILFISHRIEEIFRLADRCTVLRDGKLISTHNIDEVSRSVLIREMTGEEKEAKITPRRKSLKGKEEVLGVRSLKAPRLEKGINFSLREGEILGLLGTTGSGRNIVGRAIVGAVDGRGGEIYRRGKRVRIDNPRAALDVGISLVPADREKEGVVSDFPVVENITLPYLDRYCFSGGWIHRKDEVGVSQRTVESLDIRIPSLNTHLRSLSGGNQQKIVVGKYLTGGTEVMIFNEASKGLDVGVKKELYKTVRDLSEKGLGIIWSTNETPEATNLCDRLLVMFDGEIVKEIESQDATQEELLTYMLGGKVNE